MCHAVIVVQVPPNTPANVWTSELRAHGVDATVVVGSSPTKCTSKALFQRGAMNVCRKCRHRNGHHKETTHLLIHTASETVEHRTPAFFEFFDAIASATGLSVLQTHILVIVLLQQPTRRVPKGLTFTDLDLDVSELGGVLSWVPPPASRMALRSSLAALKEPDTSPSLSCGPGEGSGGCLPALLQRISTARASNGTNSSMPEESTLRVLPTTHAGPQPFCRSRQEDADGNGRSQFGTDIMRGIEEAKRIVSVCGFWQDYGYQ